MGKPHAVWLVRGGWALGMLLCAAPPQAGDLQVFCSPGVRVFLDGRPVGVCNEREDGVFVFDVPAGTRAVRAERDGYLPKVVHVEVGQAPVEVMVGELVPLGQQLAREETTAVGGSNGGMLVVTSAPQRCTVALGGEEHLKTTPQLVVPVAAGEHMISFSRPGFSAVEGSVRVPAGGRVTVRGNLLAGKVEVLHAGKGSVRVLTRPDGASVSVAGRSGQAVRGRLNLSHLPSGEHLLTVRWGRLERSVPVLVVAGQRAVVTVSLVAGAEEVRITYEPE